MGFENDLVLVSGSKFTCFFCRGIEIDLILELGWNQLGFGVGIEMNLFFVWEIELALILVWGSKLTWFLFGGSKLTLFLCAGRK